MIATTYASELPSPRSISGGVGISAFRTPQEPLPLQVIDLRMVDMPSTPTDLVDPYVQDTAGLPVCHSIGHRCCYSRPRRPSKLPERTRAFQLLSPLSHAQILARSHFFVWGLSKGYPLILARNLLFILLLLYQF